MAHTILLGLLQNPDPFYDDCVALGGADPGTPGYYLKNYVVGQKYKDNHDREFRDITITVDVFGSSISDVFAKISKIQTYLTQTMRFLEPYGYNIPSSSDGSWFPGRAASLTFQPAGASTMLFWDVLSGEITLPQGGFLGPNLTGKQLQDVVIKLQCNATAKGSRVYLENLVACGDFNAPFALNSSFSAGWGVTGTGIGYNINISPTLYNHFYTLSAQSSNGSAYSNSDNGYYGNDTLTPSICFYVNGSGITTLNLYIRLQVDSGAGWTDVLTLCNYTSLSGVALNQWVKLSNGHYTRGFFSTESCRLAITCVTDGRVYFDGAAIWRNLPDPDTLPKEYVTYSRTAGMPTARIYNVQGDIEAPYTMFLGGPGTDGSSGGTASVIKNVAVGGQSINLATDNPLYPLDLQTSTGVSSSTMFWYQLASPNTTSGSTTVAFTIQSNQIANAHNYKLSLRPTKYRAYLVYAANNAGSISKVTVTLSSDPKTFSQTLPQTYSGAGYPTAAQYAIWDLGDITWPRQGTNFSEKTLNVGAISFTNVFNVIFNVSGTSFITACAGLILIPTDQYAFVSDSTAFMNGQVIISSESTGVRVTKSAWPFDPNFTVYQTVNELVTQNYGADNLKLIPGQPMRLEILALKDRDSTYNQKYTFDASLMTSLAIAYSPRYALGVAN